MLLNEKLLSQVWEFSVENCPDGSLANFHTNPYNFVACLLNPYKLFILGDIWRTIILPFPPISTWIRVSNLVDLSFEYLSFLNKRKQPYSFSVLSLWAVRYAAHFLHGLTMIFLRDSLCLSAVLPYRGNDIIFWIFPIVPCHAFCMWHWPIGRDLDLSFIWGHHHLSEYMDISRTADYFIACYIVLMRLNNVETAVHGCNSWLSVWTLSCHCPVKLFA